MQEQKYKLIDLLCEEDYFSFGEFTLKNGRVSPYIARFPSKLGASSQAYQLLSQNAIQLLGHFESAHIIGLANSGKRLAESIYKEISILDSSFTHEIINPKYEVPSMSLEYYLKPIVVIDNAVTTGKTLIDFKQTLFNSTGAEITLVVRIFDRLEIDNPFGTIDDYLKHAHGILVSSIINVHDLIDYLRLKKDEFNLLRTNNYVTKYCKNKRNNE